VLQQGARFAKWRGVVSIPAGPSSIALRDCAYGLARYAAIAQVHTHSCSRTRMFFLSGKCFPCMQPFPLMNALSNIFQGA